MLGAAPVTETVVHSEAFVRALDGIAGTIVDLGSGGGVPGLVIAWRRADLRVVLVDRRLTRADHLRRLVVRLGIGDRVAVVAADADRLPHLLDEPVAAVVARGFGSHSAVLAAARPILGGGGLLVVSEPPGETERWTPGVLGADFRCLPAPDARVALLERVPRGT
jgi:16S rRNA (guanine527-N7)-methyltransferase